ncbi:PSD1 and planctomycete cytochrome C domain-containing protein [Lentisphaera marina]|uniref:PSD1 and planctomycete cytochrome C domain-containing protein n=1 Tax=Lentisphaera marina TaxID=1111041 RepID=UPI00236688A8|nr:PSD1 and planctomycete cytochrome C domain-containing protein [Lentisphaera marina]MDD7983920.1 PSD1 and planctomycete cytochrome C domain-containing protein [Lentisphaera marina]
MILLRLFLVSALVSISLSADEKDLYLDKIKPLFKERCFACHGVLKQKGKLRLDTVEFMHERDVINNDELIIRLESDEEDEKMPPEGHSLSKKEIDFIKSWIAAGAPAPENEQAESDPKNHWSFQRIEKPETIPPAGHNPVDFYLAQKQIDQKLKTQGLSERSLLIRRLYFDLIGLPPTPEQMKDSRSIEEITEELLASPQYGERWGRHWMDVWRYSDWYGLDKELRDSQKHLWHWRDWIVNSLNEDKGYDQMITEMLAADEIAPNEPKTIAATGFLARNYYKFNRTTWLDNVIEHTGKAFMGLTMNCAKCHDHKYDPIDHTDYYNFRAIFEPYHVRTDALPDSLNYEQSGLPRVYDEHLDTPTYLHKGGDENKPHKRKKISSAVPQFLGSFAESAKPVQLPLDAWAPGSKSFVHVQLRKQAKGKIQQAQKIYDDLKNNAPVKAPQKLIEFTELSDQFQTARPDTWDMKGSGWRYQGGILSNITPTMERNYLRSKKAHPRDFELNLKFQTTGGKTWKSTGAIFDANKDGSLAHGVYTSAWSGGTKIQFFHIVNGKHIYPNALANIPIKLNEEYRLKIQVRDQLANVYLNEKLLITYNLPHRNSGSVELFSFDSTADFYAIDVRQLDSQLVLKTAKNKTIDIAHQDLKTIAKMELDISKMELDLLESVIIADKDKFSQNKSDKAAKAGRMELELKLAKARFELAKANPAKRAHILKSIEQDKKALKEKKYPAYTSIKGSLKAHILAKDKVEDYSPLYPKTSTGRRTALAKWFIHRDHPLTARVAINHIWMRHFGTPLVDTVFDFGRQAPKPLHQDLLDYLAVELIESNWSMKHIHKIMLSSKAWQRSSSNLNADVATISADPENKYYWRMNPRRMESQILRDGILALSGKLELKMGGPTLTPSPSAKRRSIYFFHSRDGRSQFLEPFDDADVFSCYRRSESIVPQQALALMNSQTAIEAAEAISKKFDSKLSNAEFCRQAYYQIIGKEISPEELELCLIFLQENKERRGLIHSLLNLNDFLVIR